MPALRVLSVVVLAGLGAAAAGLAGGTTPSGTESRTRAAQAAPLDRTTTSTASRGSPAGFDTRTENARPGSPGWRIPAARGTAEGLDAWAGAVSVRAGQRVALHVADDRGQSITVRAFRIGWYGGTGARQVWSGTLAAGPTAGQDDPKSWPIRGYAETSSWPPGQYLLRLDQTGAGDASRFVPLLVRSPRLAGALAIVTAPLTWQAVNGSTPAGDLDRSFDRPYGTGYGAGSLLTSDAPIIQLAERDGRSVAYTSDLDLAQHPELVDDAAGLVFGSASQYWPAKLRTAVIEAIEHGTNAAFFGAGTGTRRIDVQAGGRTLELAASVPPASTALTGLRPVCSAVSAPGAAASLNGSASWAVQDPDWWGYARVDVSTGQALPGLVSGDPDGLDDSGEAGAVLAQSAVGCVDGTSRGPHAATYWTTPAGAGVFATGTSRWACAAGGTCPQGSGSSLSAETRRFATQVTRVVLKAFAEPRAGRTHPA